MRGGYRARLVVNLLNGSTAAGLLVAAAGRARLIRAPHGLLVAVQYRLPVPPAPAFCLGNVIVTRLDLDTAEFGGYTRGPRIIDGRSMEEMRRILGEIRDGSFTRELVEEFDNGRPNFLKRREALHAEQIEQVGAKLRPLMSWLADDDADEG